MKRKILTTYALIYANGSVHLGHLLGYIQADIWVRFQKMRGHDCIYICGSDTHGTPIMLKASERQQAPADMVAEISDEQLADFQAFGVNFDQYELTNIPENQALSNQIYKRLKQRGDITTKTVRQAFDETHQMFLPDRYVKGTCPCCGAEDQYSDSCEACGSTYDGTTGIKNPISALSGKPPIYKDTEHFFFQLSHQETFLKEWVSEAHLQGEVARKLQEWFKEGLQDWCISRDAPYYGFEIPDAPGKYFYVWLDAPVGYLASTQKYCERVGGHLEDYWAPDAQAEIYHFIGKDITYFHTLFWPAMLAGAQLKTPDFVQTHGFLTINGAKMSKSRKTFITGRQYLDEGLNPEALRYYYASKLSANVEDIDLSFEDFKLKVNADLVGKFVNIASRCASFIHKYFDGKLASELQDQSLFDRLAQASESIASAYEQREFAKAMREIMALSDLPNQFIELHKPWDLVKTPSSQELAWKVCTSGLNAFMQLMVYLKPVLPQISEAVEAFLQISSLNWDAAQKPLLNHAISPYQALITRVDDERLKAFK